MRFNLRSISTKLILFILTGCLIIFAILFGYNYYYSKKIIFANIQEIAENTTLSTVHEIETVLRSVQALPQNIAYLLEHVDIDNDKALVLLKTIVDNNPDIYGMALAFEPYKSKGEMKSYSPYYYKDDVLHYKDLANDKYNYTKWDWFKIPKKQNKTLWSEPFYDEDGGDIMMATYSVPFYTQGNSEKLFRGVVTADISLTWLENIICSINIADSGYAFIMSRNGFIMHHPKTIKSKKGKLLNVDDVIHGPSIKEIMHKMLGGESGFASLIDRNTGEKIWISFAPIQSSDWSVGIIFPREELMASTIKLHKTVVLLGFMGFIILFFMISLIASSITRPLKSLAGKANEMSDGDLDVHFPKIKSRDEVGILARSFINMRDSLKKYIRELTETTAEKQRMESELEIAKHIQMSMVPRTFPPFPGRKEIDLHAVLIPAKQVGGDLYDYFFLDDERLCLIIGDVAGKGVPAALFMAKSVTLLKASARETNKPADILQSVNSDLAYENDSCIFVTAFIAILNVKTGELNYANGGHNPPILLRHNNEIELIDDVTSPALGAIEGGKYIEGKAKLLEGDILFMYTDGVTEAFDRDNNEFSSERLVEDMSRIGAHSAKEVIDRVLTNVRSFSEGAEQSDDITIVAIEYLGKSALKDMDSGQNDSVSIVLKNEIGELIRLSSAIDSFGDANSLSKEAINAVALALEELFTNTVSYGYKDSGLHSIKIDVELVGREIRVRMEDDAIAFNPLDTSEVDVKQPIEKMQIGGLGLHLVKKTMDKISYERSDNKNVLRIVYKL